MSDADGLNMPDPPEPAAPLDRVMESAGHVVNRLISVGLSLERARKIVGDGPAGDRLAAATDEVDRMIGDIRAAVLRPAGDRQALLDERLARSARALQVNALNTAALLEQRADLVSPPARLDYPTEIKRWRAFADQAEKMAERWGGRADT